MLSNISKARQNSGFPKSDQQAKMNLAENCYGLFELSTVPMMKPFLTKTFRGNKEIYSLHWLVFKKLR